MAARQYPVQLARRRLTAAQDASPSRGEPPADDGRSLLASFGTDLKIVDLDETRFFEETDRSIIPFWPVPKYPVRW
jgi:hypothetical protein